MTPDGITLVKILKQFPISWRTATGLPGVTLVPSSSLGLPSPSLPQFCA